YLNRTLTFADHSPPAGQWARFVATNAVGGLVNYGSYSAIVTLLPAGTLVPLLGVAVGAIAGLGFNFTASRRLVFRPAAAARPGRPRARP
ncbi:MAG: GtrA family protein, partial [Burkholderiales bacterium]